MQVLAVLSRAFFCDLCKKIRSRENIYNLGLVFSSKKGYNKYNYEKIGGFKIMNLFFALTDAGTPTGGGWITIVMLVGMFAVFYFVGIRPQKKQEKAQNDMRNALTVGDEITTIGGIIGKIISIKEETCVIETSHDRTQIRILKSAISRVDVKAEDAD